MSDSKPLEETQWTADEDDYEVSGFASMGTAPPMAGVLVMALVMIVVGLVVQFWP